MSVISTMTGQAKLNIPYKCKCVYCGTPFSNEKLVSSENVISQHGYMSEETQYSAGLVTGAMARLMMPYEIVYETARLEHYRQLAADGRLKTYFETGKARKEDWFTVEKGSELEAYLNSKKGKSQFQYGLDQKRLKVFPYYWINTKNNMGGQWLYDKCPACKKKQPWCVDTRCNDLKIAMGLIGGYLFTGLMVATILLRQNNVITSDALTSVLLVLSLAAGLAVGLFGYRLFKKRRLTRFAALPVDLDHVPEFDAEAIARTAREEEIKDEENRRFNWPN